MAKTRKPVLPPTGAAFAFDIGDGRYSVCRVLAGPDLRTTQSSVLVACSAWIGDQIPRADNPALRPILVLNHHAWPNEPHVIWVCDATPKRFRHIGSIVPTRTEQLRECLSFTSWEGMALQPLLQWRWDNERDGVLAEDAREEEAEAKARRTAEQERKRYLKTVTLDVLRRHRFFPRWKGYPLPKAIRASRRLMTQTVEKLQALGPRRSRRDRMAILQECIETFNDLDVAMSFIETVEREDICEEFEAIVHACGMGSQKNLADRWREW